MTKQSLLFLLICSALFNLFFVAGALMGWDETTSGTASPRETRLARIAAKLELTAEQQNAFEVLQSEHEEEAELLGDRIREIRNMISTELNKEKPDLETVDGLAQEETRLRSERRHAGTLRFEEFLQHLDPTQRKALGAEIRRYGDNTDALRRMLKDFDKDQNGILDEQERKEAEAQHEQRKRERRERREKLRQRFDSDGDGTLSPDEQRALHEFTRQQRDQHPRPRDPGRGRGGPGPHSGGPAPRSP